jgi:hypothetical protein
MLIVAYQSDLSILNSRSLIYCVFCTPTRCSFTTALERILLATKTARENTVDVILLPFHSECLSIAMEHFFTPTQRYRDMWGEERDDDGGIFEYTEVELAAPLEDFLIYIWHWEDLLAFVTGGVMRKLLWITENAFLFVKDDENPIDFTEASFCRCIDAEMQAISGQKQTLTIAYSYDEAILTGEVAVFWHALATSNSVKLTIKASHDSRDDEGLPSGPILSQFFRGSSRSSTLSSTRYVSRKGTVVLLPHC